jgi:hypothetical protein
VVIVALTITTALTGCGLSGTIESIGPDSDRSRLTSEAISPAESTTESAAPTTEPPTTTTSEPTTTTEPLDPTEQWRLDLEAAGTELPGGGTEVFPDRRIVAFYGSPVTGVLGTLGERPPEANIEQLRALAAEYGASMPPGQTSAPVVPAFELIITVASSVAGGDGDYSNEMEPFEIRPWVEAATEAGAFVILDLQPGRTDFLTQAKRYEEFLRLPNVGLALDPEWRLKPDQRHMRQIGSVGAAEINTVVDYLVQLVHEEALPQKILVLHQFKRQMLPDRELVRTPPELAVVVHADGQGPLGTKYETWAELHRHPEGPEQTLWWGWKNFYDEDTPMATPAQTNAVEPLPVVITYQ